jgi:hypothetical protein
MPQSHFPAIQKRDAYIHIVRLLSIKSSVALSFQKAGVNPRKEKMSPPTAMPYVNTEQGTALKSPTS